MTPTPAPDVQAAADLIRGATVEIADAVAARLAATIDRRLADALAPLASGQTAIHKSLDGLAAAVRELANEVTPAPDAKSPLKAVLEQLETLNTTLAGQTTAITAAFEKIEKALER